MFYVALGYVHWSGEIADAKVVLQQLHKDRRKKKKSYRRVADYSRKYTMNSVISRLRWRFITTSHIKRYQSTASGHAKEEYSSKKETHFGYENVSEDQKAHKGMVG